MAEAATALENMDPADNQPLVDLHSHIPALSVTLGGKIGLHALRHNARALGLDFREWRIIQILGSEGRSTVFEVADFIAMDRGGTSRSISRLEGRGIVQRKNDPSDRRRSYLELTPVGWDLHEKIVHFALAREERLLKNVSHEDAARLRKLLNILIAEADQMVAEGWTP